MAAYFDLPNEITLISAAQLGNLDAFNKLVLHYQDAVYNLTYRILDDRDTAADATQKTFIRVLHRLETYAGRNFRAWLLRVAINTCYNMLRDQKRHPLVSLEGLVRDNSSDDFPIPDSMTTLEQLLEVDELRAAIEVCINDLSTDQRIALVMRDIEGYSYQEIAASEDVQVGTIKSRLNRARMGLRKSLQQYRELLPPKYHLSESPQKIGFSNKSHELTYP